MKSNFQPLQDEKYKKFIEKVRSFKQGPRYYIVDFVSIEELRSQNKSNDEIADETSEYFDDQEWPIRKDPTIPVPEHWEQVDEERARDILLPNLTGGPEFGHREYAIQPKEAEKIWQEFIDFFDQDRTFHSVNLGNRDHVFMQGILIIDKDKAGVLNIVHSD